VLRFVGWNYYECRDVFVADVVCLVFAMSMFICVCVVKYLGVCCSVLMYSIPYIVCLAI
jgi:hypothetical protein